MMQKDILLAVTGGSGASLAKTIIQNADSPVRLVASDWGQKIYESESEPFTRLTTLASKVYSNDNLMADVASGSCETAGMIVAPCSANTLAAIANGLADTLITRAAHCHLKERKPLVLCIRESPWTLMMLENARTISLAGGIISPVSLPYYTQGNLDSLMSAYAHRVLSLLGQPCKTPWTGKYEQ